MLIKQSGFDSSDNDSDALEKDPPSAIDNHGENETQLYKLRWWIAAFSACQIIVMKFLISLFGIMNNVFKTYYDTSYYVVDWFSLIQLPAGFVATIILANLLFNSIIGFRKLLLILSFSILLGCIFSIIASIYPFLYGLIFVGQFCAGFGYRTTMAILSMFASSWFPEKQIGLAISIKTISVSVGSILSYIIPTQLMSPPPFQEDNLNNITSDWKNNETIAKWKDEVMWKFISLYGSLIVMSLIALIFTFIYVVDEPPKPPTIAQAKVRAQKKREKAKTILANIGEFLRFCRSILVDKVVWQLVIIGSVTVGTHYLQRVLIGEIIRDVFVAQNYNSRINQMAGYVMALNEVGGFIGGLAMGKALDYSKRYKVLLLLSLVLSLIMMLGLTLACYFVNVVTVYIFNTLLGFTLLASIVSLLDMLLQHTYPKNPGILTLIFFGEIIILVIPTAQIFRVVLNYFNGPAVLACLVVLFLVANILAIFLNPSYNRLNASKSETGEDVALLCEDN